MTDTPVFSVARNRELVARAVQRAREEERQKLASALEVQANTIGGVIGAALREVAGQVTGGSTIAAIVVGTEARRDFHDDGTDPPLSIPFEALTEPQRQRRLARHAIEMHEAGLRMRDQQREDEARIAREASERRAMIEAGADPDLDPAVDALPPVLNTTDDDDFTIAQRKLR